MSALGALSRLLERAERGWARSGKTTAALVFTEASNPEYLALRSFVDKQAYHALLIHAEHKRAISIEWETAAGPQHQVKRIRIQDADVLAELLNVVPRWRALERAREALEPLFATFPVTHAILAAWQQGRKIRGWLDVADIEQLLDAARTIARRQANDREEVSVRRLSAQLGFDSKRLESLAPAIDLLTSIDLDQPSRDPEETFAELGIVKHPSPVLLSGRATLKMHDGVLLPVPSPYVGVAPDSVASVQLSHLCRAVLSVENLTIFHDLTALASPSVLLIYSNGMPSPSWRRFFGRMLSELPHHCRLHHWGDIDGGGYRIAAHIANLSHQHGRTLGLYRMNPATLPHESSLRALTEREKAQMERLAQTWAWSAELDGLRARPMAYEQEALDLDLPATD